MTNSVFVFLFFVFVICIIFYYLFCVDERVKIIKYLEDKYDCEFYRQNQFIFDFDEFYFTDRKLVKENENITVFKTGKSTYHDNYFYFLIRNKIEEDIFNALSVLDIDFLVRFNLFSGYFDDDLKSLSDYDKFIKRETSDLFMNFDVDVFLEASTNFDILVDLICDILSKIITGGDFMFTFHFPGEEVICPIHGINGNFERI